MKQAWKVFSGALLLASGLMVTSAVPSHAEDDQWDFVIAPYVWALDINADVGIGTREAAFDVGFSDILKRLQAAPMGRFEAWKGSLGLTLDVFYVTLVSNYLGISTCLPLVIFVLF